MNDAAGRISSPGTTRREHWDTVYSGRSVQQVSWYQADPRMSVELVGDAAAAMTAGQHSAVIDVGGGTSVLADPDWPGHWWCCRARLRRGTGRPGVRVILPVVSCRYGRPPGRRAASAAVPVSAAIPGALFAALMAPYSAAGRGRQFSRAEDGLRPWPAFMIGW
jgi:hypothetical protein